VDRDGSDKRTQGPGGSHLVHPELSQDEMVAVVDRDDNVVDAVPRAVMRARGLIHRATYILVFSSKGELFVQERTMTKDIFPGYYDLCTGGVVLAGEGYEPSARRELKEEIGVEAGALTFLFGFYGEYAGQKVWGRAFSATSDGPFTLQAEEVSSGAFYSREGLEALIREKPCTPDSVYVYRLFEQARPRGPQEDQA
jgi:8-oxo-dGTP pyrophosphatase MutT (NUDIX family)